MLYKNAEPRNLSVCGSIKLPVFVFKMNPFSISIPNVSVETDTLQETNCFSNFMLKFNCTFWIISFFN